MYLFLANPNPELDDTLEKGVTSDGLSRSEARAKYGQPVDYFGKKRYPNKPDNSIDETPSTWVLPKGQKPTYAKKAEGTEAATDAVAAPAAPQKPVEPKIEAPVAKEAAPIIAQDSMLGTPPVGAVAGKTEVKQPPKIIGANLAAKKANKQATKPAAPEVAEKPITPVEAAKAKEEVPAPPPKKKETFAEGRTRMAGEAKARGDTKAATKLEAEAAKKNKTPVEAKPTATPKKEMEVQDQGNAKIHREMSKLSTTMGNHAAADAHNKMADKHEAAGKPTKPEKELKMPGSSKAPKAPRVGNDSEGKPKKPTNEQKEQERKAQRPTGADEKAQLTLHQKSASDARSKIEGLYEHATPDQKKVLDAASAALDHHQHQEWSPNGAERQNLSRLTGAVSAIDKHVTGKKTEASKVESDKKTAQDEAEASKPKKPSSNSEHVATVEHRNLAQQAQENIGNITNADPQTKQLLDSYKKVLEDHASKDTVPTKEEQKEIKDIAGKVKKLVPKEPKLVLNNPNKAPAETEVQAISSTKKKPAASMSAFHQGKAAGSQVSSAAEGGSGGSLGSSAVGYAGGGVVSAGHHLIAGERDKTEQRYVNKQKKDDVEQSSLGKSLEAYTSIPWYTPAEEDSLLILKSISSTAKTLSGVTAIVDIERKFLVQEQGEALSHVSKSIPVLRGRAFSQMREWVCTKLEKSVAQLQGGTDEW